VQVGLVSPASRKSLFLCFLLGPWYWSENGSLVIVPSQVGLGFIRATYSLGPWSNLGPSFPCFLPLLVYLRSFEEWAPMYFPTRRLPPFLALILFPPIYHFSDTSCPSIGRKTWTLVLRHRPSTIHRCLSTSSNPSFLSLTVLLLVFASFLLCRSRSV